MHASSFLFDRLPTELLGAIKTNINESALEDHVHFYHVCTRIAAVYDHDDEKLEQGF